MGAYGQVRLPSGTLVDVVGSHQAADSWPLLDGPELDALAEDIRVHGQRVRVVLTPDRLILDGRNRIRACQLAGVVPLGTVETVADPAALVESLNEYRRHMTRDARAARHAYLREQGKSVREIAGITGASVGTVHNDLHVFSSEHVPAQVTGTDGRSYPARRPAPDEPRGLDVLFAGHPQPSGPVGEPTAAADTARSRPAHRDNDLDEDPDEAAAARWTGTVARAIGGLYDALGDDPGAAVARSWRPGAHPWRGMPGMPADLYEPAGLRRLAERLADIADHLETTGTAL